MLKAVRQKRKAKEVISDNFTISNTNFKPCSITLSNKQLFTNVLNRINDLGGVPSVNECFHIVTKSQINSFDFILLFLATNKIDTLTIAFYRIGKKIVQELKDLHDKGQIRKINLLVNDGVPKLCPDVYNLIKQYEKDTFQIKLNLKCKTTKNNVINSYKEDYFFDRKIREDRVLDDLDRLFQN